MYDWIYLNTLTSLSLFIAVLTATLFLHYLNVHYNYFKSLGIDGPKPYYIFGNLYQFLHKSIREILSEDYKKYGRIYGWFFGTRPILMISEPCLIKDIFTKDFHKFVDRHDLITGDLMVDRSLFNTAGEKWKKLRYVISPTFSSSKMRAMHPLLDDCVNSVEKALMKAANNTQEIELKQLMGNLTMDAIATCVFATKIDTHTDPNNAFVSNAGKVFRMSWRLFLSIMTSGFSVFGRKLKLAIVDSNVKNFFTSAIISIMKNRKNNNKTYVDFLQLMINSKNKENLADIDETRDEINYSIHESGVSSKQLSNKSNSKLEITDTDIIVIAYEFLAAGYESTSATLMFLFYSLSLHQQCQQKLYLELKNAPQLDYDTIAKLPYLSACIAETQRLYTTGSFNSRLASEDYVLGSTGITVPKGMLVFINVEGIHHDPQYYPNPYRFDPERFMPENHQKLIPYTFLPFGIGPRHCVGMRFALMEMKTAIASVITKFRFVRTTGTVATIKFAKMRLILTPETDIKVGVEVRCD